MSVATRVQMPVHTRSARCSFRQPRIGPVARDQVVLPAKTLALLDRNVIGFARSRSALLRSRAGVPLGRPQVAPLQRKRSLDR